MPTRRPRSPPPYMRSERSGPAPRRTSATTWWLHTQSTCGGPCFGLPSKARRSQPCRLWPAPPSQQCATASSWTPRLPPTALPWRSRSSSTRSPQRLTETRLTTLSRPPLRSSPTLFQQLRKPRPQGRASTRTRQSTFALRCRSGGETTRPQHQFTTLSNGCAPNSCHARSI